VRNECLDTAIATLREAGVFDYQIVPGSKHPQLRWQIRGQPRFYALPSSPLDWRSSANVRSDMRRLLRDDGLLQSIVEPAKPPPRAPSLAERVAKLEALVQQLQQAAVSNRISPPIRN
jgi:hypothetical protein